jgi:hypothetical protein
VPDHIESAGNVLRDSLSEGWEVETRSHGRIPPVSLTGTQLEQIVTNLGFLSADSVQEPSVLRIEVGGVDMPGILRTERTLAGVLIVGVTPPGVSLNDFTHDEAPEAEYGVIESVLKSTLLEAGGNLETVIDGKGNSLFRVSLPMGNVVVSVSDDEELPDELKAYVASWSVVLAAPGKEYQDLDNRMSSLGLSVTTCDSIAALLAAIEQSVMDAMVIDSRILGAEPKGILRALLKLRPSAAIIVLCEDPEIMPREIATEVIFRESKSTPDSVIASMIEAKTLSARRTAAP